MEFSEDNKATNLTNQLLIAMPQLRNTYFENTVIYMWQHSDEGALGLVINLPMSMQLSEIFEQLGLEGYKTAAAQQTVLSGGPVETDKGFILHDDKGQWASTFNITENLHVTTSRDILEDISRGEGPENYLVMLGCSGWSSRQLEAEIAENSWLTCPADKDIIFSKDYANKPQMAAASLGFDLNQLTSDAGELN